MTALLLLILAPLFEIYLFIHIGSAIGALPTLFITILTAFIGVAMLRVQGINTLFRYRGAVARGEVPAVELLEGFVLLVGGALLLTPGFLTDGIGFLCLLPASRMYIVRHIIYRIAREADQPTPEKRRPDAIDVKFRGRDIDD